MSEKELPARPDLEQYRKQAKDLVRDVRLAVPEALARIRRHHPRFHKLKESDLPSSRVSVTDAQLVIAREHGFESWPKFAKHLETERLIRAVGSLPDPVSSFLEVACVPRHSSHASGTLEHAEIILARYPDVAARNIYTAAVLADERTVRRFLSADGGSAADKGGPHHWDALTYLCFSRYLRLDPERSTAFVRTAEALLDAGASARTGWFEIIDHPTPRPTFESAIYGAAGVAQHLELTRLLLERGADPNDEETPYHVPEGYDNRVMNVLLESGKLNESSLSCMLVRKADWHDEEGLRLLLAHGANPNFQSQFGVTALHQAVRRDNGLPAIELLLDYGADPTLKSSRLGLSAASVAARRGRGDVLELFKTRGAYPEVEGVDRLIAACARANHEEINDLVAGDASLLRGMAEKGGTLLAEYASNGNVEGLTCLLDLGIPADALYPEGDGYFEIAVGSTALHVAAWRAWPQAVKLLVERGAPVNAVDGRGRTAIELAVRACVDSYWKNRRSPESVEALLRAGASAARVKTPTGYDEVDLLLRQYRNESK